MSGDMMFCSEADVKDILLDLAHQTDTAPYVFVSARQQSENSYVRMVTFVIQTREGNEALIDMINKASIDNDRAFIFEKSEVDIQSGNLEVDYIFVRAGIYPKLTKG